MMSRVGGFPAGLAKYFIASYSKAADLVLDPFCGKGTVLLEGISLGRPCIGGDIGPDAVVTSRAKCAGRFRLPTSATYVQNLRPGSKRRAEVVPDDVAIFFSKKTLCQLLAVRAQLLADMERPRRRDVATFVCGVMLGLLHGHSKLSLSLPCNQVFAMAPNYVRKYALEQSLERPDRDVKACLLAKALELLPAPRRAATARIIEAPANRCDHYVGKRKGKVTLVLTSPPYLNRQTYIKDAWLRLWFLARNRTELYRVSLETGNVVTFVDGMKEALEAMARCVVPGGTIILVCGQARGTIKGQDKIIRVADLCLYALDKLDARSSLFVERIIMDRKLMKRGSYFAVHHGKSDNGNGVRGARYGEDEILVMKKRTP